MTTQNKPAAVEDKPVQEEFASNENFAELLQKFEEESQFLKEGTVVKGVIIEITDKGVAIDVGAKSVGYIQLTEFKPDGEVSEGDLVDVYLEKLESKRGDLIISRENARRDIAWKHLKDCLENKIVIEGKVLGKVKGGYAVDVDGITAFLPRSQVDTVLITDDTFLINSVEKLMVLKIDDVRGNVVVSRRAILQEVRNKERAEVLSKIKIGDVLDGVVKNIVDYGAFIDFGSFDGLLHLTDISWCRVRHPSEVLKLGQDVKVQVINYDDKTKRISLGMKQLQDNPWESIEKKYPVGTTVKGHITNIANYGVFVEIENGIEGLVYISEISWLKNNTSPNKVLSSGQEVEVMILDINAKNHRISLGIKQCSKNPWQTFSESHKVGDVVDGLVKNKTEFGLFIGFDSGVDGLIHNSDITDGDQEEAFKQFKKDTKTKIVILGIDYEKERISLGVKQLANEKFQEQVNAYATADISVKATIVSVKKDLIEVETDIGAKGIVKRLDISSDKFDQKTDKFKVGDTIEAKTISFNGVTGKLLLSLKDSSASDSSRSSSKKEKTKPLKTSTSSSSGATLGSILGDVLQESRTLIKEKAEKAEKAAEKAAEKKAEKVEKKEESETEDK